MIKQLMILQAWFQARSNDERGVTAVEYGLMVAFVAGAIIVGAGLLGTNLNGLFNSAGTYLGTVTF